MSKQLDIVLELTQKLHTLEAENKALRYRVRNEVRGLTYRAGRIRRKSYLISQSLIGIKRGIEIVERELEAIQIGLDSMDTRIEGLETIEDPDE